MISAILFVVSPRLRLHKHHHPAPLDSILHLESRESTSRWFSNPDVSDEATVRTVFGREFRSFDFSLANRPRERLKPLFCRQRSRTIRSIDEHKENLIHSLIDFDNRINHFFSYQMYFLAAEVIIFIEVTLRLLS